MTIFRDIEPGDRVRLTVRRGGLGRLHMFAKLRFDPPPVGTVREVDEENHGWRQIFVDWDEEPGFGVIIEPDDLFDAHREGVPK